MIRAAALIPALDAAATIAAVVEGAKRRVEHVLVVDDGSRDETARAAESAGAEVLRHGENLGKGAALAAGLWRLRDDFSHAVSLDADGQHLEEEIPKLLAEAERHPAAIVVGARQIDSEVAPINRFGNWFADLWIRLAAGRMLGDTQSGFRVYPIEETLALQPVGRRYDFEAEVLIRAARAAMDVRSVPVRVYYPPPAERKSHYDKLWDTARIVQMVLGLMLRLK